MKKIIILSVFALLFGHSGFSQVVGTGGQAILEGADNTGMYVGLQPKSDGVKGTPFIFEDLIKGKLLLKNGKVYEDIAFNIHPEKSEIFVEISKKMIVPETSSVDRVIAKDGERIFAPVKLAKKLEIGEILYEGEDNERFMVLHGKRLQKADIGGGYNSGPQFDEFLSTKKFVWVKGTESLEISSNNKGLKILNEKKLKELKSFVKTNNLDLYEPEDMAKVFKHAKLLQ